MSNSTSSTPAATSASRAASKALPVVDGIPQACPLQHQVRPGEVAVAEDTVKQDDILYCARHHTCIPHARKRSPAAPKYHSLTGRNDARQELDITEEYRSSCNSGVANHINVVLHGKWQATQGSCVMPRRLKLIYSPCICQHL
ncbi:MAG: hypothetical protein FRX49_01025 [Trebouxia sp. A1-2]|nr:MAG: hypothetical protein FRX49_01025 [Trebouxia sp. A1-2]